MYDSDLSQLTLTIPTWSSRQYRTTLHELYHDRLLCPVSNLDMSNMDTLYF